MPFMQKQVTNKCAWIEIETSVGTEFIEANTLFVRDSQTATHPLTESERANIIATLINYTEGVPREWKTVQGYGARLSAPGYLDCTEWTVFDTAEEAQTYLDETYDDEEADDE